MQACGVPPALSWREKGLPAADLNGWRINRHYAQKSPMATSLCPKRMSSSRSLQSSGHVINLTTRAPKPHDAVVKTKSAVRQLRPVRLATRNATAVYNAIMRPITTTTGSEKKAYRCEKARNIQTQLKPTPVMTPSAIRDQGIRRCLNLLAPSSSIVSRVFGRKVSPHKTYGPDYEGRQANHRISPR